MELYDKDSDAVLSADELKNVPGILFSIDEIDKDGDKRVTLQEFTDRLQYHADRKVGLMSVNVIVMLNGRPLKDATVVLEPEPFMSDAYKPAEGVTDMFGTAYPTLSESDLPKIDPPVSGVRAGFYKIRVTYQHKGKQVLPARYNTETELGAEIVPGAEKLRSGQIRLNLRRK